LAGWRAAFFPPADGRFIFRTAKCSKMRRGRLPSRRRELSVVISQGCSANRRNLTLTSVEQILSDKSPKIVRRNRAGVDISKTSSAGSKSARHLAHRLVVKRISRRFSSWRCLVKKSESAAIPIPLAGRRCIAASLARRCNFSDATRMPGNET